MFYPSSAQPLCLLMSHLIYFANNCRKWALKEIRFQGFCWTSECLSSPINHYLAYWTESFHQPCLTTMGNRHFYIPSKEVWSLRNQQHQGMGVTFLLLRDGTLIPNEPRQLCIPLIRRQCADYFKASCCHQDVRNRKQNAKRSIQWDSLSTAI